MKLLYLILFVSVSFNVQAAAPTVPSSNLSFNAIDGGYFNLGWTPGNGSRRLIICKAGGPVTFVPQNGVDYTENTIFGSGQQVAPGEYVIYDHFSTSFFLTGLTPATQYFFRVYDYNGTGTAIEYLTSAFLSGNATTSATPTVQTSNAVFTTITTNSVNLTWTNGNGLRRLIVVREGAPVNADPVSNQVYNVSFQFGNGATTGTGNYTVYNSTGTGTNVANLRPGTQYFFAFYEFNGSSQPQYLAPAYTTSVTTRSIPTVASSNLVISKTDGKELSLNWTNGNGQRRIVVAKQGSNITANPANGTDYNANPVFGTGQQLSAGEYVVYDDNFNATTISGLNPATTYYFKIFEYDGTGSNTAYLTSSFASVNGPTAVTPDIQAANLTAGDITSNSLRLQFSAGNGRARTIIGRKDAPVSVTPADFTLYTADANFGNGHDLGNGNFVMGNTTGELINIHNLQPNSTYHFAVFEYNGFNQPLYLSPAAAFSATTSFALPVKLVKWEATPANGKVKLQWTTASEVNAGHFVIERSADGVHYTSVATVQAAGNSTADIQYSKEDPNPLAGKSYYRLKMVDLDGKTEYSPVRTVILSTTAVIRLAANPVQEKLELIASAMNGRSEWQIINAAGQTISKGVVSNGRTEINVAGLKPGNYWVRVIVNNEAQALAFVKL
ncbi:MAG: T9SS type A sorting domain-containing protein [Chitinophagaceae bacterium]|nr:T9SS type A sorting domain-containing protein [Chitinophagaceae bacterium]